jgi:hypothetical protein
VKSSVLLWENFCKIQPAVRRREGVTGGDETVLLQSAQYLRWVENAIRREVRKEGKRIVTSSAAAIMATGEMTCGWGPVLFARPF